MILLKKKKSSPLLRCFSSWEVVCLKVEGGRKEYTEIMLHYFGAIHPNELGTKSGSRSPFSIGSYHNVPVEG